MIVEFSTANYKSINKVQTLSFRATGLTSDDKEVDRKNIYVLNKDRILKIIGTYGANASGKSNLIKALSFFKDMIDGSIQQERLAEYLLSPFRLSDNAPENAGYFQAVLLIEGSKYRYGFTLNEDASIQSEWLFGPASKKETYYFKRTSAQDVQVNETSFEEGLNLPKGKLRDDALFLTFVASYDGEVCRKIKSYFSSKVKTDNYIDGKGLRNLFRDQYQLTDKLIEEGNKQVVLDWMKEAGIVFQDVSIEKTEIRKGLERKLVRFGKNIYSENGEVKGQATMSLQSDESEGTQKFYSYIGQLYELFDKGGIFISDEIDSNFHPSLLQKLIGIFQNSKINRSNAQLLFTSHDTNLLNPNFMRRDQFYFTEKTIYDETILYSLADLRGIRNNADFARQYLAGLYGATPQLSNYIEEPEV